MEIRYLKNEEKSITRELYEEVFNEDTDRLVSYYYDRKAPGSSIIACIDRERAVGMLHLCPKIFVINNTEYSINYIYAVATKSEYRRQGIMERMLVTSLCDMERQGEPFAYLSPENENIYTKYGFATVVKAAESAVDKDAIVCAVCECDIQELVDFAGPILRERYRIYERHDSRYFADVIGQMKAEDGRVDVMRADGCVGGYSMSYPDGQVREILYDSRCAQVSDIMTTPTLMIRILNLRAFVSLLKSENTGKYTVRIHDDIIRENEGVYDLKVTELGIEFVPSDREAAYDLSIGEFTEHVFGYKIIKGLPRFFHSSDIFINGTM